jgi:hypothetical protein
MNTSFILPPCEVLEDALVYAEWVVYILLV